MTLILLLTIQFSNAEKLFNANEVRQKVCHALCRSIDGKEVGFYIPKLGKCFCGQARTFKELTEIKITIEAPLTSSESDVYSGP